MHRPDPVLYTAIDLILFRDNIRIVHKMLSPAREGWVVFDVLNEINRLKDELNSHPHRNITFTIKTYKNKNDLVKDQNGQDCHNSSLSFERDSQSFVHPPLLIIYSNDDNLLKLNISAIIQNIRPSNESSKISRTKRNTNCGRHTLDLTIAQFNDLWRLGNSDLTVLAPHIFRIGVCGGQCRFSNYPNGSPQHSAILYFLGSRHPPPYNMTWKDCCAPVAYNNVEVLLQSQDKGAIYITPLWDLSVSRCGCLRTVTNSKR